MGKIVIVSVIFIFGAFLNGTAMAGNGPRTVIGCVDIAHLNHGLGYYSLQVQRVGVVEGQPIDQVVLTTSGSEPMANGESAMVFKDVEEFKEASSLDIVGPGIRLEIGQEKYYDDMIVATVTLRAGPYNFQDVAYACHFY